MAADEGYERNVVHRMNQGWGAQKGVLSNRGLGTNAKKCLCDGVIVPTARYGTGVRSTERRKVNVLEMKCEKFVLVS